MDRSTPAVRMIKVWPAARAPTTAICWTSSDNAWGRRNSGEMAPKTMIAATSTISGLRAGLSCSRCCSRSAGLRRRLSRSSTVAGLLAWLLMVPPFLRLAPALLGGLVRCLALDAGQRLVGGQGGAGVEEVLAGSLGRRSAAVSDGVDRADADLGHLAGVLH